MKYVGLADEDDDVHAVSPAEKPLFAAFVNSFPMRFLAVVLVVSALLLALVMSWAVDEFRNNVNFDELRSLAEKISSRSG